MLRTLLLQTTPRMVMNIITPSVFAVEELPRTASSPLSNVSSVSNAARHVANAALTSFAARARCAAKRRGPQTSLMSHTLYSPRFYVSTMTLYVPFLTRASWDIDARHSTARIILILVIYLHNSVGDFLLLRRDARCMMY